MGTPRSSAERSGSLSRIPSAPSSSKIPRASAPAQKTASFGRTTSIPRPGAGGVSPEPSTASSRRGPATARSTEDGAGGNDAQPGAVNSDRVLVTVRLRPLSERERVRGDREVWAALDENTIGVKEGGGGAKVKYVFDSVLGNTTTNKQVYSKTAKGTVAAAMDGLNATIFAYGVTSSGKTYTMMGTQDDPGIVQRAVREVFRAIERSPERDFLLRFSMMEIYNEVLNDLLDPARANLRMREDPSRGFFVEGIKEETLVSVEHALSVIAAGDAHRKVSATAFNDGSSRSHTIMRLSIESSERPGPDADPRIRMSRTLSFLNLIDLAGSESARATLTKGHAREGSFINKSLLTLGTVIAKLSDGNAAHIPFRDSKLTRLLQSSMTGSGARISVVATATPTSSQAEETHNTLKFATRAKKIEIHAKRNEILDQSSLIMRYQAEIAALRQQLEEAAQGRGVAMVVDPLHPEVRNLRERLEEEHQALLQREQDKTSLEVRIARLTRIILHSTRIARPNPALGYRYRQLLLRESQASDLSSSFSGRKPRLATPNGSTPAASFDAARSCDGGSERSDSVTPGPACSPFSMRRSEDRGADATSILTPTGTQSWDTPPWDRTPDVAGTVASIRSAGDLFAGSGLLNQMHTRDAGSEADLDAELMREQMRVMADELDRRELIIEALRTSEAPDLRPDEDAEVELQIMAAEREFLESKLKKALGRQRELVGHIHVLRRQLLAAGMHPEVGAVRLRAPDEASSAGSDDESVDDKYKTPEELRSPEMTHRASEPSPRGAAAGGAQSGATAEDLQRFRSQVSGLESELRDSRAAVQQREAELRGERSRARAVTEREQRLETQLRGSAKETLQVRSELERVERLNNSLQGYALDDLSEAELDNLIGTLAQAEERVRATAQMRRLSTPAMPVRPLSVIIPGSPANGTESLPAWNGAAHAAAAPMYAGPAPPERTIETEIGPYAPMRRGMNSLARAVSNLDGQAANKSQNLRRVSG